MKTYECSWELVVNPSFRDEKSVSVLMSTGPEKTVYVPALAGPDGDLGMCFLTEAAAKSHWWLRPDIDFAPKGVRVKKMTMAEFMRTTDRTGMNPFETLNRTESVVQWQSKYGGVT